MSPTVTSWRVLESFSSTTAQCPFFMMITFASWTTFPSLQNREELISGTTLRRSRTVQGISNTFPAAPMTSTSTLTTPNLHFGACFPH